jgi:hypothetical protein
VSSVARLVFTYFTARPLMRWFTVVGLVALVAQTVVIWKFPYIGGEWGSAVVILAWASCFVGSVHMPTMVAALNRSHVVAILPGGRRTLFWSTFVTVLLVSLPVPLVSVLIQFGMFHATHRGQAPMSGLSLIPYLWMYWGPFLFVVSWLYVGLWFVMSKRSVAGAISGMLVMVVVVLLPTKLIVTQDAELLAPTLLCLATWLLFAAYFFWWPRVHVKWPTLRRAPASFRAGREVDFILGTASPWSLALPLFVPVLFSTVVGKYSMSAWLLLMTIFSAVTGAIAASAAARSRAIWLRTRWSREELFAQVERRFWRHNGFILAVLIALLAGIALYGQLPAELLARGLPLMALGMALSTYLGLMQTQSLRLPDAAVAAVVMVTLMLLAVISAKATDLQLLYTIEIALALLAVALRFIARARWTGLDWRLCRADPGTAARSCA